MRILFRTEGNHTQGMGDVFGSLAIAEQFNARDDEVLFLISGGPACDVLRNHGYKFDIANSVEDERRTLHTFSPDAVVVNKLNNSPTEIAALQSGAFIVTIDDSGEGARFADLNINVLYPIPGSVSDLKYVALRHAFADAHARRKQLRETVSDILVMQGGSDTYGFIPMLIRALPGTRLDLHFTIVVGPAFRHHSELHTALRNSAINATVAENPASIISLMESADVAISAGGITMFELCCLGVPSIIVCAERFEISTADRLEREGAVINVGFGGDLHPKRLNQTLNALIADSLMRSSLSANGHRLIDGRGSERIAELLRTRAVRLTQR